MASTRTFLINASTRHAIYVQRLAGSQLKDVYASLDRIKSETIKKLSKQNITKITKSSLNKKLKDLDKKLESIYAELHNKVIKHADEFAAYEADFSARMFTKATEVSFSVPASSTINAAVKLTPMKMIGADITIEQALKKFTRKKRQQLATTIKDGVIAGQTDADIISSIATATNKLQRQQIASLVRTVTNHVSTVARDAVMKDNEDIVKGYEWVSTLDGGTTQTCQALDGQVFSKRSTTKPPQHWGCRSTIIPVVKKKYSVSDKITKERPAIGSGGVETVKGTTNYNSWLKKQSKSFQIDVLGKNKAKLFREGGLQLKQFVDHNYKPLTLKQLKRREPLSFAKAGLDDE